jgi:hypothetical protein
MISYVLHSENPTLFQFVHCPRLLLEELGGSCEGELAVPATTALRTHKARARNWTSVQIAIFYFNLESLLLILIRVLDRCVPCRLFRKYYWVSRESA